MFSALAAAILIHSNSSGISSAEWYQAAPPVVQRIARQVQDEKDGKAIPTTPPALAIDPKHQKEIDDDIAMGQEVANRVHQEMKMSSSQQFIDRVKRIGDQLATIADENHIVPPWGDKRFSRFDYKFEVLEGDDINAFSLPGGFIFVYEGLVRYAETDHELAGVLAHEIAHASFRHVATMQREYSRMQSVTLPLILISLFTGGESGLKTAMATNLLEQAVGSGWSVKAEESADYGGLEYMIRSKYSAVGMLTFMERLAFDERNRPAIDWGIYRTHPPSKERAQAIYQFLREHDIPVERSLTSTTFRALTVEEVDQSFSVKALGKKIYTFAGNNAKERAEQASTKLNEFFDEVPRLFELNTNDFELVGRGTPLFEVSEADAEYAKMTRSELLTKVVRDLKATLFDLSYRALVQE